MLDDIPFLPFLFYFKHTLDSHDSFLDSYSEEDPVALKESQA